MDKDYYKILGIDKKASKEEIKKAFRKLAHKHHPDKKTGDENLFKEASEAYSVLSDDKKRAEYDSYGRIFSGTDGFSAQGGSASGWDFSNFAGNGQFSGFQNAEFDLGDIFNEFFGGQRERMRRGRDISIDLQVSFKDIVFGTSRSVLLTKVSQCSACGGSGSKEGSKLETCSVCNGSGKIHETKSSLLGTFTSVRVCSTCHGTGKVPKEKCTTCKGQRIARKEEEIVITIPAGINDGEMIRLTGAGEATSGGASGDLYVKIHVTPHPLFRKEGTNLVMDLNIKLTDALLGSTYTVSTLDGDIKVKIPAGISFGEILRVRNKGVVISRGKRGDLLIRIQIKLPAKISREAKDLITKLHDEGI